MKDSTKIFIILLIIIGLAIVSVVQSCKVSTLKKEVDTYKKRAEMLNDSLDIATDENNRLRDMMARANDALEKMVKEVEAAKDDYDRRNEKIYDADIDWLMCPLPDEVREAFGEYCYSDAGSETSDNASHPL